MQAGDELEVVHLYTLSVGLTILVYDLTVGLIEGEAPKGQDGFSHVPCHPLRLFDYGGIALGRGINRSVRMKPGNTIVEELIA